jgi:hypothetical protein
MRLIKAVMHINSIKQTESNNGVTFRIADTIPCILVGSHPEIDDFRMEHSALSSQLKMWLSSDFPESWRRNADRGHQEIGTSDEFSLKDTSIVSDENVFRVLDGS